MALSQPASPADLPGRIPGPVLVLAGIARLKGGAALAVRLISLAGIFGTVALSLGFGALGLAALTRPRGRLLCSRSALPAVPLGAILVAHHPLFYAVHRLPLGVAVTEEFAGPLCIALTGAAVALASEVIACSLQAEALRKLSILSGTEPAAGAIAELVAFGQTHIPCQWAGISFVSTASVGTARTSRSQPGWAAGTIDDAYDSSPFPHRSLPTGITDGDSRQPRSASGSPPRRMLEAPEATGQILADLLGNDVESAGTGSVQSQGWRSAGPPRL